MVLIGVRSTMPRQLLPEKANLRNMHLTNGQKCNSGASSVGRARFPTALWCRLAGVHGRFLTAFDIPRFLPHHLPVVASIYILRNTGAGPLHIRTSSTNTQHTGFFIMAAHGSNGEPTVGSGEPRQKGRATPETIRYVTLPCHPTKASLSQYAERPVNSTDACAIG